MVILVVYWGSILGYIEVILRLSYVFCGLHWGYSTTPKIARKYVVHYWGYTGVMEKKMETELTRVLYWGSSTPNSKKEIWGVGGSYYDFA